MIGASGSGPSNQQHQLAWTFSQEGAEGKKIHWELRQNHITECPTHIAFCTPWNENRFRQEGGTPQPAPQMLHSVGGSFRLQSPKNHHAANILQEKKAQQHQKYQKWISKKSIYTIPCCIVPLCSISEIVDLNANGFPVFFFQIFYLENLAILEQQHYNATPNC